MAAPDLAFIGFGEAAQAFAGQLACLMRGYDRIATPAKRAEFAAHGVEAADSNAAAIARANMIFSVVTADQALAAAEETARGIRPTSFFFDCNSVAPDTKREAARAIEAAGGRYVDVAVMAPVYPKRLSVPLLIGGPHAAEATEALRSARFHHGPRAGRRGRHGVIDQDDPIGDGEGHRGAVRRMRARCGGCGGARRSARIARRQLARGELGNAVRL